MEVVVAVVAVMAVVVMAVAEMRAVVALRVHDACQVTDGGG